MRAAIAVVALAGLAVPGSFGQSPAFEVATIKANHSGSGGSSFPGLKNGTLAATNVSLKSLLQAAYDISALRITGPDWLDADRFDLAGKSPQGIADTDLMPMLQALLRERFQLEAHREMKEMPVYDLVAAKSGFKMQPYNPAIPFAPPRNRRGAMIIGGMTMPQLAMRMTYAAGRPIIDKTGIEGSYICTLTFTPLSVPASNATDTAPDLFTAVQEQLGLKLEPSREPIEILVVDHAQRVPSDN